MTALSRRAALMAGAWSVPVIAGAVAAPALAASETSGLVCSVPSGDVAEVEIQGDQFTIRFHATAQNTVDVTIRLAGEREIHYNLARVDRYVDNGQPHEKPYYAGGFFTIALPRPFDRACDWFQVQGIHSTDCVAR